MTHTQNDKLEVQLHVSWVAVAQSPLFLSVSKNFKLGPLALSLKLKADTRSVDATSVGK